MAQARQETSTDGSWFFCSTSELREDGSFNQFFAETLPILAHAFFFTIPLFGSFYIHLITFLRTKEDLKDQSVVAHDKHGNRPDDSKNESKDQ
jgi:hypothetical protein